MDSCLIFLLLYSISAHAIANPCLKRHKHAFPHDTDCDKYVYCKQGVPTEGQCPKGQVFDKNEKVCLPASVGVCYHKLAKQQTLIVPLKLEKLTGHSNDTTPSTNSTPSATIDNTPLAPNDSSTSNDILPPCNLFSFYVSSETTNCESYYLCTFGWARRMMCPFGFFFSPTIKICVPQSLSGCTPATVTNSTPEALIESTPIALSEGAPLGLSAGVPINNTGQSGSALKPVSEPLVVRADEETDPPLPPLPPCTNETWLRPDPTNCSRYYICLIGEQSLETCVKDFYFDPKTRECLPKEQAGCSDPPTATTQAPVPPCGPYDNWISPYPPDCTMYYRCYLGQLMIESCPYGYEFSPTLYECLPKEQAGCRDPPTTTTQAPVPPCGPSDNWISPYPPDCTMDYRCYLGQLMIESCPYGYEFSPTLYECLPKEQAGCHDPPTTTTQAPVPPCGPSDNWISPYPPDCSMYYRCYLGQLMIESCPYGYEFSPTLYECLPKEQAGCHDPPTTTTQAPVPPCGPSDNWISPYPPDCSMYYRCYLGQLMIESCPYGYEFSPTLYECLPKEQAGCHDPPTTTTQAPVPPCGPYDNWISPYPANCTMYYRCYLGQLMIESCPYGYEFSPTLYTCLPKVEAGCSIKPTASTPLSTSTKTTPSTTSTKTTPSTTTSVKTTTTTTPSPWPACQAGIIWLQPDRGDSTCKHFILCVYGKITREQCPPGYLFNSKTLKCDLAKDVRCNPDRTCKKTEQWVIPDPNNCKLFIQCSFGDITYKLCPAGYEFSPTDLICEPKDVAGCSNQTTTTSSTTTSTKTTTTPTTTSTKTTTTPTTTSTKTTTTPTTTSTKTTTTPTTTTTKTTTTPTTTSTKTTTTPTTTSTKTTTTPTTTSTKTTTTPTTTSTKTTTTPTTNTTKTTTTPTTTTTKTTTTPTTTSTKTTTTPTTTSTKTTTTPTTTSTKTTTTPTTTSTKTTTTPTTTSNKTTTTPTTTSTKTTTTPTTTSTKTTTTPTTTSTKTTTTPTTTSTKTTTTPTTTSTKTTTTPTTTSTKTTTTPTTTSTKTTTTPTTTSTKTTTTPTTTTTKTTTTPTTTTTKTTTTPTTTTTKTTTTPTTTTTKTTTTPTTTTTKTTTTPTTTTNPLPQCDHTAEWVRPDQTDCEYFIICIYGQISREHCPPGFEFNPVALQCQPKDVAGCNITTTTSTTSKPTTTTTTPSTTTKTTSTTTSKTTTTTTKHTTTTSKPTTTTTKHTTTTSKPTTTTTKHTTTTSKPTTTTTKHTTTTSKPTTTTTSPNTTTTKHTTTTSKPTTTTTKHTTTTSKPTTTTTKHTTTTSKPTTTTTSPNTTTTKHTTTTSKPTTTTTSPNTTTTKHTTTTSKPTTTTTKHTTTTSKPTTTTTKHTTTTSKPTTTTTSPNTTTTKHTTTTSKPTTTTTKHTTTTSKPTTTTTKHTTTTSKPTTTTTKHTTTTSKPTTTTTSKPTTTTTSPNTTTTKHTTTTSKSTTTTTNHTTTTSKPTTTTTKHTTTTSKPTTTTTKHTTTTSKPTTTTSKPTTTTSKPTTTTTKLTTTTSKPTTTTTSPNTTTTKHTTTTSKPTTTTTKHTTTTSKPTTTTTSPNTTTTKHTTTTSKPTTTTTSPSTTTTKHTTTTSKPTTTSTTPSTTTSKYPKCGSSEKWSRADPTDCRFFYICVYGDLTYEECPDEQEFNPIKLECQPPEQAQCNVKTTSKAPMTLSADYNCDVYESWTKPDPYDCSSFYFCVYGHLMQRYCPTGFEFSPTTNECAPKDEAECNINSDAPVTVSLPGATDDTDSGDTNCHPTSSPYFTEDPEDCTRYYFCSFGKGTLLDCPEGSYFSKETKICIPSDQVICKNKKP